MECYFLDLSKNIFSRAMLEIVLNFYCKRTDPENHDKKCLAC